MIVAVEEDSNYSATGAGSSEDVALSEYWRPSPASDHSNTLAAPNSAAANDNRKAIHVLLKHL